MASLRCRVLGHRPRVWAEGPVMRWRCHRCPESGQKTYASAEDARRYAQAFDLVPWHEQARRAPLLGLFPLRLARLVRRWLVRRQAKAT